MNHDNATLTQVAITIAPRLNNALYAPLFQQCGGIAGFFEESNENIKLLFKEYRLANIQPERSTWLQQAEEELKNMEKHHIQICGIEDPHYPRLLKHCADAPLALFYKGTLTPDETKNIAIVGTRKATDLGKKRIESILGQLTEMGYRPNIISGLAYGIDIAAHTASLRHGLRTQAVLGHGLNMIYPAQHKHSAEKIVEQGGVLLSEFPTCAPVHPSNFLQRNRIVAGMSEAVLVAESPVKGGAMSTARLALSYNRDVLAFPGRPEDANYSGCNMLIKQNIAALVENVSDILKAVNWEPIQTGPRQTTIDFFSASNDEETIKQILTEKGEQNIDQLYQLTRIPVHNLTALLLQLELKGIIAQLPGNCYTII